MARPTVKPTKPLKRRQRWPAKCARRRTKPGNKKEATKRNPSQCSSKARSRRVAEDLSPWRREYRGASMIVDHWQFDSWRTTQHLILTKSLIIQVPLQTSPSSNKPLFSPPISVFPSLSFVQVGRSFHQRYLHFMIFRFSSPSPSLVGRFFIDWSLVWFSSSIFPSLG